MSTFDVVCPSVEMSRTSLPVPQFLDYKKRRLYFNRDITDIKAEDKRQTFPIVYSFWNQVSTKIYWKLKALYLQKKIKILSKRASQEELANIIIIIIFSSEQSNNFLYYLGF